MPSCGVSVTFVCHVRAFCQNELTSIFTGRPARSAAMSVLHLLSGSSKMVFCPAGATHRQISRLSNRNSNFRILATNLPSGATRLPNFYETLSICTRLYVDFKILSLSLSGDNQLSYKHFPAVGASSHKFSITLSGETTARIKDS